MLRFAASVESVSFGITFSLITPVLLSESLAIRYVVPASVPTFSVPEVLFVKPAIVVLAVLITWNSRFSGTYVDSPNSVKPFTPNTSESLI